MKKYLGKKIALTMIVAGLLAYLGLILIENNSTRAATGLPPSGSLILVTKITDSRLIPVSVNLLQLDAAGKVMNIMGALHDDGINGDAVAGDKIFSILYPFNKTTLYPVYLRTSWALTLVIRRTLSGILAITDPISEVNTFETEPIDVPTINTLYLYYSPF